MSILTKTIAAMNIIKEIEREIIEKFPDYQVQTTGTDYSNAGISFSIDRYQFTYDDDDNLFCSARDWCNPNEEEEAILAVLNE